VYEDTPSDAVRLPRNRSYGKLLGDRRFRDRLATQIHASCARRDCYAAFSAYGRYTSRANYKQSVLNRSGSVAHDQTGPLKDNGV
jgi:hypothetical protein